MSVFDVVMLGRRPHISWRISDDDHERVSETIRFLGLEDFAFRKFDRLSGGERQRVVIAKAVAQDPMLFLLDEPTSDLDLRNQVSIMKKIRHIVSDVESGKSAIVAIHDINMAARFADRVILLDGGSIKADGTPSEVLTEANIADVFGVSCDVIPEEYGLSSSLQVLVKDEIEK
jgi:iron complex transport system ATP-binding protein